MSLTFGQAKEILAQYQGKGGKLSTSNKLDAFVIKVLKYLLITGSPNAERSFDLYAVNGRITAPYELDVPLKIKINGRVGNVVTKWFEFRSGLDFSEKGCYDASDTLFEDGNPYFTVYDLPACGGQLGVSGTVDEDCDAHVILSGDDGTGREIFTQHKGAEICGEYLSVRKNVITWSNVHFGSIDGVYKSRTKGYVQLYWRNGPVKGFLSDYPPLEEAPTYRRFNLSVASCPSPARVTILGKTRLKEAYLDNERIPFDNEYAIEVAGQQVNANYNTRLDVAKQQDNFLETLVTREATHKKTTTGTTVEMLYEVSPGAIKGIVE